MPNVTIEPGDIIEVGRKPSQSVAVEAGQVVEISRTPAGDTVFVTAGQVREISRTPGQSVLVEAGPVVEISRTPARIPADFGEEWDILTVGKKRMPGLSLVEGVGYARRVQKSSAAGVNGSKSTQLGTKHRSFTIKVRIWTAKQREELESMLKLLFPKRPKQKDTSGGTPAPERAVENTAGFLIDYDTTLQGSPERVGAFQRAQRGEGLYVDFGRFAVINSPALTADEALTRKAENEAKIQAALAKPVDVEHPALRMFGVRALHFEEASLLHPSGEPGVFAMEFKCTDHVPGNNKAAVGAAKGSKSGWDSIQNAIVLSPPTTTDSKP